MKLRRFLQVLFFVNIFIDPMFLFTQSLTLSGDYINLTLAPSVGGRIEQLEFNHRALFWNNSDFKQWQPTQSGLDANGAWLNYGGEKLWPAPQGWDGENQWPGPPGAVLDGQAHAVLYQDEKKIITESKLDPETGIKFRREITLVKGASIVDINAQMINESDRFRRWGIWSVAQLNPAFAGDELNLYVPINQKSKFEKGYDIKYGIVNNPQFKKTHEGKLLHFNYQGMVGKVGLDSDKGWAAGVYGESGIAYCMQFQFDENSAYPDDSSVEIWAQGRGAIFAANSFIQMSEDQKINPAYVEMELLSPYLGLNKGERGNFHYQMSVCLIGGNFPVKSVNSNYLLSEPLWLEKGLNKWKVGGRVGFFKPVKLYLYARKLFRDIKIKNSLMVCGPFDPLNPKKILKIIKKEDLSHGKWYLADEIQGIKIPIDVK